ncbi:MAG: HEAT repeat domain-containing protein [Planctomycetota bacterium]|nr:HEAT repeat domain-containing protein [Planctomycetota bacterium]
MGVEPMRRRLSRVCAASLATCVSLWTIQAPSEASAAIEGRGTDPVVALLLASDSTDPTGLDRDLAALGPGAIPRLFAVLEHGRLLAEWIEGGDESVPLLPGHSTAVLRALALQPHDELIAHLEGVAAEGASRRRDETAMLVLGAAGTEHDYRLLVRLAQPGVDEGAVPMSTRDAFEEALDDILRRRPASVGALHASYRECPTALLAPMVRAIGRQDTAAAISVLSGMLGPDDDLDPVIFNEIARLGARIPHPIDDSVRRSVRFHLNGGDSPTVQAAIAAAGGIEDWEALPDLELLLGSEDQNVRWGSAWALRKITDRDLGLDPAAWATWREAEMEWWVVEAPQRFAELASDDPVVASRAILEIAQRRLYRHELATSLAAGLDRTEPGLLIMICTALGQLGSPVVLPGLVNLLEHDDPGVQASAWQALTGITGENLPLESASWRKAFEL